MKKIYVGIGHGGSDPGACANNLRESDLNLNLGLQIAGELQRCGLETKISRTADVDFNTAAKIADANHWGADLVFDVHHNAGGGIGFEIYRSKNADGSEIMAQAISDQMDAVGRKNRGVKVKLTNGIDYFGIIRQTDAPAVLIEYGFVDNATDAKLIADSAQQRAWVVATAKGICTTLGIDYAAAGATTLYRVQAGAFQSKKYALSLYNELEGAGYDAYMIMADGYYKVQVGAYAERANADQQAAALKKKGYEAFITTQAGTPVSMG